MTPEQTQIARLETEVETLTQRCKAFEEALSAGGSWEARVHPLSLYQTRLMRLIARKDMTGAVAVRTLATYYPDTSSNAMDAQLVLIRRVLPAEIAPRVRVTKYDYLAVPDRAALIAFLSTGELPSAGKVAA